MNKFYRALEIFICCETLHKYLNENLNMHVTSGFGFKVMSFRDLSKLLAIAPKSSKVTPYILKQILFPFTQNFQHLFTYTKLQWK